MYHDRQIAAQLHSPSASTQDASSVWLDRGFYRVADHDLPRLGRSQRGRDASIGLIVALGFSVACWTALACWYFG